MAIGLTTSCSSVEVVVINPENFRKEIATGFRNFQVATAFNLFKYSTCWWEQTSFIENESGESEKKVMKLTLFNNKTSCNDTSKERKNIWVACFYLPQYHGKFPFVVTNLTETIASHHKATNQYCVECLLNDQRIRTETLLVNFRGKQVLRSIM